MHPVPLTQVRSFVTREISLREHRAELDPEDPKIEAKVTQVLDDEVRLLILNARQKNDELLAAARAAGSNVADESCKGVLKYTMEKPNEVLVRVRVEHMGFTTLNNQRFGAKFVGEVANPSDMLLFHRKKDIRLASAIVKKSLQPMAPEELERTNMEDLVREALDLPEQSLKLLEEQELTEAMEDYVDKSLVAAIPDKANGLLKQKQLLLIKGQTDDHKGTPTADNSSVLDSLLEASQGIDDTFEEHDTTLDVDDGKTGMKRKGESMVSPAQVLAPNRVVSRKSPLTENPSSGYSAMQSKKNSRGVEVIDIDSPVSRPTSQKAANLPKTRGRPRKVNHAIEVEDSDEDDFEEDEDIDDDEDDDVVRYQKKGKPQAKTRNIASSKAKTSAPRQRATTKKESKTIAISSRRRKSYDDSDEDENPRTKKNSRTRKDDVRETLDEDWGTAATAASQRRYR